VQSIELVGEPDLGDFYYWNDDSSEAWIQKLIAAEAKIKVTYTPGNPGPREHLVKDAVAMNDVWENYLGWYEPGKFQAFGVKGIKETQGLSTGLVNARLKTNILLNYRGATTPIEVPVMTRLVGIETDQSGETAIPVDMRRKDNDIGNMDAAAFSKLIKVYANFTGAGVNADKTAKLLISFDTDNEGPDGTSGAPEFEKAELYTMNFGEAATPNDPTAGSADTGWADGWGQCDIPGNNGRDRNVTLYYAAPEKEDYGLSATSARTTRVSVHWEGIRIK